MKNGGNEKDMEEIIARIQDKGAYRAVLPVQL